MTIMKIIDGLYFTIGMMLFNPLTGESKTPDQLNEDDRTTYDACMGAIALLRMQEPVEPYMDFDGDDIWRCGKCGTSLFHVTYSQADNNMKNYIKFCKHCGRVVKWE